MKSPLKNVKEKMHNENILYEHNDMIGFPMARVNGKRAYLVDNAMVSGMQDKSQWFRDRKSAIINNE